MADFPHAYLYSPSLAVVNKPHAVHTATNSVRSDPLASILSSLCSDAFDGGASTQGNLQPLTVPTVARAP